MRVRLCLLVLLHGGLVLGLAWWFWRNGLRSCCTVLCMRVVWRVRNDSESSRFGTSILKAYELTVTVVRFNGHG